MVESVEEFSTNLDSHRFGDLCSLRHAEVSIDDSGAVEEPPAGVAKRAKYGVLRECVRQEITVPSVGIQFSRVHDHDRSHPVRLVGIAAGQRDITPALTDGDRKSGGEAGDAVDRPTSRQALRQPAESAVERNCPIVAGDKVMRDVEV